MDAKSRGPGAQGISKDCIPLEHSHVAYRFFHPDPRFGVADALVLALDREVRCPLREVLSPPLLLAPFSFSEGSLDVDDDIIPGKHFS